MNPIRDRVNERSDASANPAIAKLRKALSSGKDAEMGYLKWRRDPFTQAFLAAIAEFSDLNPVDFGSPDKSLVQYGMTCGIDLAYRLMTQPQRVFPEVFGGAAPALVDSVLDQAYTDTPDSVLDNMEG